MDRNLTQLLEQSKEPLPYHTQVNLCHDIALALTYLHSNDIIHRNLSSNNVLLIGAGTRAKVTDFGMAKYFDENSTTMTPLTLCPGTLPYMSPEALDDPPVYTKKLDCFSFGVLGIQIVTRQYPKPSPRTKKIRDPQSPTGKIDMPILETERRKSHIDPINPNHPLLPIFTTCLGYNEEDRYSSQELCCYIAALKKGSQYSDSVQQAQERGESARDDRENRGREITELQQEPQKHQDEIEELRQQYVGQIQKRNAVLTSKQQEMQRLQETTLNKNHIIYTMERQIQELKQQLSANEHVIAELQQNSLQREKVIQTLQAETQQLQKENEVLQCARMAQDGKLALN